MDRTIIYRTVNLTYRSFTPGAISRTTPLVLVHGFAEDSSIWDHQIAYLKSSHRLIIPDLPGSGRSSPLPGDAGMEELADAIKAVLDAEGISQCVLIGHSMGGYVTLAFAELYPQMLSAFGLFHSTSYADSEEKKAARRKGIDFIRKNGAAPFIKQTTSNLFSETSRNRHPEWINTLIERYTDFNPDSLIRYYEAMIRRPDRSHVLRQFPRPVLFIIGEEDSMIPLTISLQQSHMPDVSYIYILEQAGHMGMLENSPRTSHILEEFLNELI
ncbi:MAG: alpha/beta hydrolase [Chitinophagaceae bacterium]|nr:alpha/beta hydrolase [Chitinophagaceae bacterium]